MAGHSLCPLTLANTNTPTKKSAGFWYLSMSRFMSHNFLLPVTITSISSGLICFCRNKNGKIVKIYQQNCVIFYTTKRNNLVYNRLAWQFRKIHTHVLLSRPLLFSDSIGTERLSVVSLDRVRFDIGLREIGEASYFRSAWREGTNSNGIILILNFLGFNLSIISISLLLYKYGYVARPHIYIFYMSKTSP